MGNRVKGKPKQKSIKAASHSKMGSKRKLSRMGKKQKRENAGLEATFIGRSKALKMLQVTIKDFRRLCILKGIYPREPRGRVPGKKKGQTFYHIKDIRAIAHEPILEKFRDFRSFMKKIRRAAGRNESDEAARKNAVCPSYTLHHLVRERYPRFVDALSDLDDALTLTYLFAALPSTTAIKAKMGGKAKSLAAAWGAYCSTAGCITKSFISVKGVYLEATIRGTEVRWVVPHSFTQFMPEDVDYKVMATFFEFYETLLNFVLFKLHSDLGVRYPLPEIDNGGEVKGSTTFILGANLRSLNQAMTSTEGAITNVISETLAEDNDYESRDKSSAEKKKDRQLIKTVGEALDNIEEDENEGDDEDEEAGVDIAGPLKVALETMEEEKVRSSIPTGDTQLDEEAVKRRRLFAGFTFFFSREIPRGYLELITLSYGAKVGWEGPNSPITAKDASITHHIVDRPKLLSSYDSLPKSREYVQPQWILDCANFMFVLPIEKYGVGKPLPPHLSPWVDDDEEGYKPAYAEEIERLKRGEVIENDVGENEDSASFDKVDEEDEVGAEDEDDDEDEQSEEELDDEVDKKKKNEEIKKKKARAKKKLEEEEKEAHELAKSMMSRKAAHLYGRMQHGISKKQARIDDLESRRRAPLQNKEKDEDGKSMTKQKVERLKRERKTIEDKYTDTGGSMKKSKKKRRST
jgi:pescadillo protein